MEINFCGVCENLMFLYSSEDEKELYYACKSCGEKKESKRCHEKNCQSLVKRIFHMTLSWLHGKILLVHPTGNQL